MKRILISAAVALIAIGAAIWVYANRDENTGAPEPATNQSQETVGEPQESQAQTTTISYTDSGFSPSNITISVGTTVVFVNNSASSMWVASDPHPVHTDLSEFDANRGYASGETYSFTFMAAGEWGFHNHLRPGDVGTITVE